MTNRRRWSPDAVERLKGEISASIDSLMPRLIELAEYLHANPEPAWKEYQAAERVGKLLESLGFEITPAYLGLDTALHARFGSGPFRVALVAEYDALPGLGHACGHNLIAAIAVGAASALTPLTDQLGLTVEVYGTPAEEGGGGKIELLDRGAFIGLDLALMAHPAPVDVAEARPYAVSHLHITYRGKGAHAAAYPEQGRNAADALVVAQVALGLLRQQLLPSVRIHGIVTKGGESPNAIPETTEARWYVRAETMAELQQIEERVRSCFTAAAIATGCEVEITLESAPYAPFRNDATALPFYRANAERLGRTFHPLSQASNMNRASTDMGNVSQVVRAIHPYIGVASLPAINHQKEFADHCVGEAAALAIRDAATALAWTAFDVVTSDSAHIVL